MTERLAYNLKEREPRLPSPFLDLGRNDILCRKLSMCAMRLEMKIRY